MKRIMEYIGKKGGWISRIGIALDVANNTIFPLSKMIEKLENQSLQAEKGRLTDLMKEMLQVTC